MTEPVTRAERPLRYSIWKVLLLTLLIAIVPLVLVQGAMYLRQFRTEQHDELRANLEMARAVATAFRGYVEEVRRDEAALGSELSVEALFPPEEESLLLGTVARQHPGIRSLSWVSPSGTIVSSGTPSLIGTGVGGEAWFGSVRADHGWVITDVVRDREVGERTFVVAQAAHDARGALTGVVMARISLQSIGGQIAINRQEGGAYALVDGSGWLAYRAPREEVAWTERDWAARYPIVAEAQHGREASGTLTLASERQPRVAAAAPVPDTRWVAFASRPEVEVLAPIRQAIYRDAATLLFVALLSLLIASIAAKQITGPVARLSRHALEVGQGRLSQRVVVAGPRELVELGTAFSRMAEEVQMREQEHVRLLELERARAQDARLLEAVQEHTLTLLAYLDRELRYRHVNAAYCQAVGCVREEVIGRPYSEVSESTDVLALLEQVRRTGQPVEVREMLRPATRRPSLGESYWDVSVVPVEDEAGQLAGLVLSAIDVTQQVQARETRLEAERLRAQMAETIAAEINHRMKNNLVLLSGILQLQLAVQTPDSAAAQELRQAITRISSLSAVHEQLYEGTARRVELRETLQRLGSMAVGALSREGTEVTVTGEPLYVPAKLASVLAVVANELIINALKHGEPAPGGRLQIRAELSHAGGKVRLRVWNSGHPVPEGFDPKQQRGLGLKLAQGLTEEQLGGTFSLRPEEGGTVGEVVIGEAALLPDAEGM